MQINKDIVIKAKLIREEHIKLIDQYNVLLQQLENYKSNLINYKATIDELQIKETNDYQAHKKVVDLMFDYEDTINKLQNNITPLLEKMESIKNQSNLLYKKIKQDHPNVDEKTLQQQLFNQIDSLNI